MSLTVEMLVNVGIAVAAFLVGQWLRRSPGPTNNPLLNALVHLLTQPQPQSPSAVPRDAAADLRLLKEVLQLVENRTRVPEKTP